MSNLIPLRTAERDDRKQRRGQAAPPGHDDPPAEDGDGRALERPFTPLGHRAGVNFFFDIAGQLVRLSAGALGKGPELLQLCGSPDWLTAHFPAFDKDGNPVDWFNVRKANAAIVGMSIAQGIFDDRLPVRGHGVWRAGDDGIAVHLGDVVYYPETGEERAAGFRGAGALWPSDAAIPARPTRPCGADTAAEVERLFGAWNWERTGEASVFYGLWAAGLLGAAIDWRPHGLVVGPPGSGKSSLLQLYTALSPLTLLVNGYTEAGLRQAVTGRAAPLMLDEADEDPESMGRLQHVIGLLRRASGGEGAVVLRGSGEGNARQFTVMSPAVLGAVLPPPLMPQDQTRITRITLYPRQPGGKGLPGAAGIAWSRAHVGGLWARAIAGLPRFAHNLEAVRAVILERGCEPRLADQLGTILAARAMMLDDVPLDAAGAAAAVASIDWLVMTSAEQASDAGPAQCLQRLLTSSSAEPFHGNRKTIGQLIALILRPKNEADEGVAVAAKRMLVEHGVRIASPPGIPGGPLCLQVANAHPQLTRIFEGTTWAGGRWSEELRRLPMATAPKNPVKFASFFKPRCVVVPLEAMPGEDETEGTD